MKMRKPDFWLNKNIISYFFFPFSLIIFLINKIKNYSTRNKYSIKTICVGNINVGGTGKTSLAIEIYKILNKKSKIVFIKKNYSDQIDEIKLLKKHGNIEIDKNRINALQNALSKKYQIAIFDDGLQQKNINYDIKILCFNSDEGFGNGFLLPAGPLRESIDEIKKYDIAFINGEKRNKKLYYKIKSINKNIKIFEGKYIPKNLNKLNKKKKYYMFCGIGNPNEFKNTLKKHKFNIKYKTIFPDHYKISSDEIRKIKKFSLKKNLSIITTEKDYLRLDRSQRKNINYLATNLKIKKIKEFKKILSSKL